MVSRNAKKKYVYLCLLMLILPLTVSGLHFHFKNYSNDAGLPQSQVYTIYQARNGYLWIGTLGGGVSKFNGITFTNFNTSDGLTDNHVRTICEDNAGDIWFGTNEGVCRYDGNTFFHFNAGNDLDNSIVRIIMEDNSGNLWFGTENGAWLYDRKTVRTFTKKDGLPDDVIMSMLQDSKGNMWFGTEKGGVSRFDNTTFTNFSVPHGLPDNTVYSIIEDRKGNLWLGTYDGVSKYDGKTFRNYTVDNGLSGNVIKAIIEDREGNLWFGTEDGGICKFDGTVFSSITEKNGLSSNTVWSMLEDREGNIWIGTYRGGLDKYSGDTFTCFSSKDGLGDDVIRSILVDRRGNFWFGTFRGGVSRFDGKTITTFTTKDGLIDNFVLTISGDRKGNLWFGTYNGVSKYDGKQFHNITRADGLPDDVVRAILEDRRGNIWFGTNKGGISRYNGETLTNFTVADGLIDNQITSIVEDRDGMIWIGSQKGICNYDGKTFTNISEKCGLKQHMIYSIVEDKKGSLWFAAYGDGVLKYRDGSFQVFGSKDGLNNDNVVSIVFDDGGKLWIGTENGLCRLDAAEYEKTGRKVFKHYGKEEGIVGIECIHNSICKDNNGNIWVGTVMGAVKYKAGSDKPNTVEPLTHVTGLRLIFEGNLLSDYAEGISPHSGLPIGLRLPYDENYLSFNFIGLSFTVPGKVRYRYKLEGFDELWIPGGGSTYADYPNLPPGKYTFNVIACNSDGLWNETPSSFYFEIVPPFWRTWWFYILCAAGAALSLYSSVKIRIRRLKKQQEILEEKVKLGTLALKKEKEKVEKINLELESRVLERTSELTEANLSLQREIAERKKLEAQFLQAQKMEAVGTMAAGIAHDFNNLLMAIMGNVSLIFSEIETEFPHYVELKNIENSAQRGANLTRQLLGFARHGKYEVTTTDLNRVIEKSSDMFGYTRKEITFREKYLPGLWMVDVDRGQIEQVLLNLFVNAWQAMPGGGDIYLQTENVSLDTHDANLLALKPGNYVKISVTDTGVGMDEATRQRVFEPFFTTKEMGRGTGLGLASVYGIISNHGGGIHVYSEPGKGTTFHIYLPASEKEVEKVEKTESAGDYLKGMETVLLVEDEDLVADVGEKLLRKLGYNTLIARSGIEAIDIFEKNKEGIDIVILDMIMPGMSGGDVFDRLKIIDPGVKVLLSSGYSLDSQASEILARGCRGFINKPYSLNSLSQKIRSIFDS